MDNTGWVPWHLRCALLCPLDHVVSMTKWSPGEIQAHPFLWNYSLFYRSGDHLRCFQKTSIREYIMKTFKFINKNMKPVFFFKKKQKQREDTEANLRTAQVFASSGWVNKFRHRIGTHCVTREQFSAKSEFLSGHTHLHLMQRAKTRTWAPQLLWNWEELLPGHWVIV